MNFWYLLLFVFIGIVIIYLVEWAKYKVRPTNYVSYGLSFLIGGIAAYFIKEPVTQALLMIGVGISSLWIIKGLTKVSGK